MKTKALISFAVTAKLICVFSFAYADCWFSHEAAHLLTLLLFQDRANTEMKLLKELSEANDKNIGFETKVGGKLD